MTASGAAGSDGVFAVTTTIHFMPVSVAVKLLYQHAHPKVLGRRRLGEMCCVDSLSNYHTCPIVSRGCG